ncbi:hypothetical protein ABT389_35045 [Streptomyces bacillaris]
MTMDLPSGALIGGIGAVIVVVVQVVVRLIVLRHLRLRLCIG